MKLNIQIKLILIHKLKIQNKKQNKHNKTKKFLKQYITKQFLFLFKLNNNIITLITITKYKKYTNIKKNKPNKTIKNPNKNIHHIIITILIKQILHTFNLNIHYFINYFLLFSTYKINIIIIQLQKTINIINYLIIFYQSIKKIYKNLPTYKTKKNKHFSIITNKKQQ